MDMYDPLAQTFTGQSGSTRGLTRGGFAGAFPTRTDWLSAGPLADPKVPGLEDATADDVAVNGCREAANLEAGRPREYAEPSMRPPCVYSPKPLPERTGTPGRTWSTRSQGYHIEGENWVGKR
ncbi:MAG: hypothetical protein Q7T05_04960 [Dehalococcoidia bacterium]|nr:hypothetical protein [Dehalococcoidia bacterium]